MERTRVVAVIYGYLVCLAAIITVALSVGDFVKAGFRLADPLRHRVEDLTDGYGRDLSSLSAYKQFNGPYSSGPGGGQLSEPEIKQAFEDARTERIASARLSAWQLITRAGLLTVLAVGLFISHWRWLGRVRSESPVG